MEKINPFYESVENTNIYSTIIPFPGEQFLPMIPIYGIIDIMPNYYYISNFGRVISCARGKFVELNCTNRLGYRMIKLITTSGFDKTFQVHRLVMIYFNICPNCNELQVDHINGNRDDNRLCNLRWVTPYENNMHRMELDNYQRKFSEENIIDIKERLLNGESARSIANEYNCSPTMIYNIKSRKNYSDIKTDYDDKFDSIPDNNTHLSKEDIISIYEKSLNKIDDEKYAAEYNIPIRVVKNIRWCTGYYGAILGKDREPIHLEYTTKFNEDEAISIYNRCLNESVDNLADIYEVDRSVIDDIKFTRRGYSFLKDKYGLQPQKNQREHTSEEKAIEVYNALETKTTRQVAKDFNMSERTVYLIKFCMGNFEFLTTKYGLKPRERSKK